jgi:hypothetical protein
MEVTPEALLEQAKELALTKHLLENELASLRREAGTKLAAAKAHAEAALAQFEKKAVEDADGAKKVMKTDLTVVEARLKDIVSLLES